MCNASRLGTWLWLFTASLAAVPAPAGDAPRYSTADTLIDGRVLQGPRAVTIDDRTGDVFLVDSGHHAIARLEPGGHLSVLAGRPRPGFRDGSAQRAQFNDPSGIAFDRVDRVLYVADRQNHAVRRVSLDGTTVTVAGGQRGFLDGSGTAAQFNYPTGIAVTADGRELYVADTGNNAIRVIRIRDRFVTTLAGDGFRGSTDGNATMARFADPEGIATTEEGTVLVADTGNHRVRVVRNGTVSTLAGAEDGYADGKRAMFSRPRGIAVEGGSVLVADTGNAVLRRIDFATAVTSTVVGHRSRGEQAPLRDGLLTDVTFGAPVGIVAAGALWVVDEGHNTLRIVLPRFGFDEVRPRSAPSSGGTTVQFVGYGFVPGDIHVRFGEIEAEHVVWVDARTIRAAIPRHPAGTVDVRLATRFGVVAFSDFTFVDMPDRGKGTQVGDDGSREVTSRPVNSHVCNQDKLLTVVAGGLTNRGQSQDHRPIGFDIAHPVVVRRSSNNRFRKLLWPANHLFARGEGGGVRPRSPRGTDS